MECEKIEWLTWTQEVLELIPTQESNLNQVRVHESSLVQEVCPSQEVETQVHIDFPTMECDLILVIQVQDDRWGNQNWL